MTTRHFALLAPLVAALPLAGCAGGAAPPAAGPGPRMATVYFQIRVPPPSALRAAYVSPSTRSVAINVNGASPATVTEVQAGQATYTVPVRAPEGSVTFLVRLFDGAGATGSVLSQATLTATVAGDRANTIPITTAGVIRSIRLTVDNAAPCIARASTINLTVEARDATSNVIVGSYAEPVALTSTNQALVPNPASVTGPATVPVAYSGANPGAITLSASSTGVASSQITSATVTPTAKVYAGAVTTFAGSGNTGGADGTGTTASFSQPRGLVIDAAGNLYVADGTGHLIRKVTPAGVVTTLAGSSAAGFADGSGAAAQFFGPTGLGLDAQGNLYVADTANFRVRKVTPAGVVTTLAGGASGGVDGSGTAAGFGALWGLAVDAQGNVYVSDQDFHTIRKVTPDGVATTLAGSAGTVGATDGTGTGATFNVPRGLSIDAQGNLFVADSGGNRIRKVTAGGVVTSLAGGSSGTADGTAGNAQFNTPSGLAWDPSSGSLYIADTQNHRLRALDTAGAVTTLAGANAGFADGTGTAALFTQPWAVAVETCSSLFVGDQNQRIRKVQ